MKKVKPTSASTAQKRHLELFLGQIKSKSDHLINYFLIGYFCLGAGLAFFYDTWLVAFGIGSLSIIAYYSAKFLLPKSNLYQYVLSGVLGIFMAQFIYQMHGMFEMHFVAFIGSAVLITYQNWKLQFPLTVVVVIHHALFGYLQFLGTYKVYFTKLEYMDLETFLIHVLLAAVIFFICGLWAYHFKKYSERHIELTFEMGRLQEEEAQKEELMRTNSELKKTNTELDKFVYSVSHDLRAPLCSVLGIIEATEEETTDGLITRHLGMIKSSVIKLDGFIKDILDYSRNNRSAIQFEEVHFCELIRDIMDNLAYMNGSSRKVEITMDIRNGTPFHSDKRRISILLNNLVSNAIRYQNPESENPFVAIQVDISKDKASIKVKDNGIGINKKYHKHVFEMFYRVSEKSSGSGLGLYIVQETIDKLNGKISIDSEAGIGTIFSIDLPNNANLAA